MRIVHLISLAGALCIVGCAGQKQVSESAEPASEKALKNLDGTNVLGQIVSASNFLTEEHKKNRMPGAPEDLHGTLEVFAFGIEGLGSKLTKIDLPPTEVQFPFRWTMRFIPEGNNHITNHYTVIRMTNGGFWRLERAWQTGSDGQTVKEWTVK